MTEKKIMMVHGSGGRSTGDLIEEVFKDAFSNEYLDKLEDAAVVPGPAEGESIAFTTDSFVVTPVIYRGGNLGRLSICGTVNDLLMRGAVPKYLTCGFIIEEGADVETLKIIVKSMADTAKEAGVLLVAGDTKVIEGHGGIMVNTAGIGYVKKDTSISSENAKPGDVIIVSGNLGDHHACILSERMKVDSDIESDNAPLSEMVSKLSSLPVHTMRDVTRGGLGTVLKELSVASETAFNIYEDKIPVSEKVRDFCGILGLDPVYMGNEGKMVTVLPKEYEEKALSLIRSSRYGENAVTIGEVTDDDKGRLFMKTKIGGVRELSVLEGEGLPRIC